MNVKDINEKAILEMLESAKQGEKKLGEVSEFLTELAEKCQQWVEESYSQKQKQIQDSTNTY